jgi:RHS repeat-associated protein
MICQPTLTTSRTTRIKSIWYKNESTTYDFTHNRLKTLKDVTDNLGKMFSFSYDDSDRLKTSGDQMNPALTGFTVSRSYDPGSNLTGIRAGADSTTTLSYTDRNELSAIDLPDTSGDIALKYEDAGRRRKITGPGATNRFYFDAASRVATATVETGSGTDNYLYTHDSNGNILSVNDTAYAYDVLNRLKSWYDPGSDITTSYSYDAAGNLTTVKENGNTVKSLSYDNANQISSTGYGYDDNGNLVEDQSHWYVYDGDNRLKTVVSKDTSTAVASYAYDFMGRRSSSTDASETATYYHYDGWNVVAETDSTGTVTANYYYDDQGRIMAMKRDGAYYYYQFDAHGDVVSLTDSSGTIVNTYEYDPWGNHLSASEQVANPYRYAGYRWDGDTGLYYLRARYYSPGDYRFLTKDRWGGSLRERLTLNAYVYANSNPTNLIDPEGRSPIVVGALVGAGFSLVGYMITTKPADWNVRDAAISTAAGAATGALITTAPLGAIVGGVVGVGMYLYTTPRDEWSWGRGSFSGGVGAALGGLGTYLTGRLTQGAAAAIYYSSRPGSQRNCTK